MAIAPVKIVWSAKYKANRPRAPRASGEPVIGPHQDW
jgi:hypothetical protein